MKRRRAIRSTCRRRTRRQIDAQKVVKVGCDELLLLLLLLRRWRIVHPLAGGGGGGGGGRSIDRLERRGSAARGRSCTRRRMRKRCHQVEWQTALGLLQKCNCRCCGGRRSRVGLVRLAGVEHVVVGRWRGYVTTAHAIVVVDTIVVENC